MTKIPAIYGETDDFACSYEEESLDLQHFEDDYSPELTNCDLLDEDKLELAETIEKTELDDTLFPHNVGNLVPFNMANVVRCNATVNYMTQNMCVPGQGLVYSNPNWRPPTHMELNRFVNGSAVKGYSSYNPQDANNIRQFSHPQCNIYSPFDQPYQSISMNQNQVAFPFSEKFNQVRQSKLNPQPHIKKPLNAFMLYMRDVRADVMKDVQHKDSTTINQMIGKMWQNLNKSEQAKYFDRAREEREKHKMMYPEYNPRDYYAQNLRKRRRKRDKNANEPLPKKCRARYGIEQQDKWCKHCKRKKKCLRYVEGKNEAENAITDKILIDGNNHSDILNVPNTM